jgi:hypothetical protein
VLFLIITVAGVFYFGWLRNRARTKVKKHAGSGQNNEINHNEINKNSK